MEKARTERVNDQAKAKGPAAGTTNRFNPKIREAEAVAAVLAGGKAREEVRGAVADRAAARDAVAVKTVDTVP
jgi:hypothetical protein